MVLYYKRALGTLLVVKVRSMKLDFLLRIQILIKKVQVRQSRQKLLHALEAASRRIPLLEQRSNSFVSLTFSLLIYSASFRHKVIHLFTANRLSDKAISYRPPGCALIILSNNNISHVAAADFNAALLCAVFTFIKAVASLRFFESLNTIKENKVTVYWFN